MTDRRLLPSGSPRPSGEATLKEWERRFAVYAFDIMGFDTLTVEQQRVCRDAAVWAMSRVQEAIDRPQEAPVFETVPAHDTMTGIERLRELAQGAVAERLRRVIEVVDRNLPYRRGHRPLGWASLTTIPNHVERLERDNFLLQERLDRALASIDDLKARPSSPSLRGESPPEPCTAPECGRSREDCPYTSSKHDHLKGESE